MEQNHRECAVDLPIGYTDGDGRVHRHAVLRKMRGHEEALLYDAALKGGRLVTELIGSCLLRLGDLPSVDSSVVSQLYTADRNYLLLELRRATLGDALRAWYICPQCGASVSQVEDLSLLGVRRLEEGQRLTDVTLALEDGYLDREGKSQAEVTLTLPRGVDEEFVAPMIEKDPFQAHDALILRCIKRFGSLSMAALEAYGVKILRDLTMGDRRRLQGALNGQSPGVDFVRSVTCEECGAMFEGVLDISRFFD